MNDNFKPKSFWRKPEGFTGAIFLIAGVLGVGFLAFSFLNFLFTTSGVIASLITLGLVIFTAIDSKGRTLVSYFFKSTMRAITSIFIKIDPISILKSYVDDLKSNLKKMRRQVGRLRGQMHKLQEMIYNNKKDIVTNLTDANEAKSKNNRAQIILKSRKAGRLQESNLKLEDLLKKMNVMYRVLNKMYENSYVLMEDIDDQIKIKEQEHKAIMAGHSAMRSAMSIINGDRDKKELFDSAMEAMADDVSSKVGEMERFMEMSESFMQSVDLQNGIFEEEGLKMLEKWELESDSILLGPEKAQLVLEAEKMNATDNLDLTEPLKQPENFHRENQYDTFFD